MAQRERFVDNRGIRIRYLDNDPVSAQGVPVVFVPGVTDFADEYAEALDTFGARRLLVVEMRGRGGSGAPPTGYSARAQASDVESVIAAQGLERFHLMTFSRGTTPALEVAFARPGRVVTVSIGDYLPAEIALPEDFVDQLWSTGWRGRPMPARVARHTLEGIRAEARARELWSDLAALKVPVLLARGTEGGLVDDEGEARYLSSVPGTDVVIIDGAGHDIFRPSRTAFPRAVLEFIGRRAPGT